MIPAGLLVRVDSILQNYSIIGSPYRTKLTILPGKYAGEKVYSDGVHRLAWNQKDKDFPELIDHALKVHQAAASQ